jgi:hypothetical protein
MPHHDGLRNLARISETKNSLIQKAILFGTADKPVMDRLSFYGEEKLKAENP